MNPERKEKIKEKMCDKSRKTRINQKKGETEKGSIMREKKKWEMWMGIVLLLAVALLSTMGLRKTVQTVMMQKEDKKVVVIDAGHGGGEMRQNREK